VASCAAAGPSGRCFAPAAAAAAAAAAAGGRQYWSQVARRVPKDWNLPSPTQLVRPSYEWALGTGYSARMAVINALYASQPSTHWARLMSLALAEAVTRGDPLSWCYYTPVSAKEERALAAADAADAAAAAANAGPLRSLRRALESLVRLGWLLVLFSPLAMTAPLAIGRGLRRHDWMRLLRRTLEAAGPAFIK
jgi:hypothetical protein